MIEIEDIMLQWDFWSRKIADGDTSSAPRDWFENLITELIAERSAVIAKIFESRLSDGSVNWADDALLLMDKTNDLINFCSVHMPNATRYTEGARAFWSVCGMLAAERKRLKLVNKFEQGDKS